MGNTEVCPIASNIGERGICTILTTKSVRTIRVVQLEVSVLFGFRKTIVDGTIKIEIARQVYLNRANLSFYCNSHTAILNPQRIEEKRSFSESFLHALLFLEKAGSTA